MGRDSLAAVVEARLSETEGGRFVDLCVDWIPCTCSLCGSARREVLFSGGGRWDREAKEYVGDATDSRTVTLQPAQLPAARWFALWLRAHRAGRGEDVKGPDGDPCYTLLLLGGRRGGKSDLAVKAVIAYAVSIARSICWIVVAEEDDAPELERVIREQVPSAWYRHVGASFHFMNGSEIEVLSSYDPDDTKRGRCDVALVNEAQKQKKKVYDNLAGAAVDHGGLVILAANPPDTADGEWVAEIVERSRAGKTDEMVFDIDARANPHVKQTALRALRKRMDERTYAREVEGRILPRTDVVFYAFSPSERDGNVRPTGRGERGEQLIEVTSYFLGRMFGAPAARLHGIDFGKDQHMAAATLRFFENPRDPAGPPFVWWDDGFTLEQGNEEDLVNALERRGYTGEDICVIDASGEWQDTERTKGRASADMMRKRGWRRLFLPDSRSKRNPPIEERLAVTNGLFKDVNGERNGFVNPKAIELVRMFRLWPTKFGQPAKSSPYIHIGDAATYPPYRLFPRRAPSTSARALLVSGPSKTGGLDGLR
jgi:hypothetical protein